MVDVVVWGLVAAALLVGELLTLALVAGLLGVGAVAALLVAATGAGLPLQLVAFGASSALLLTVVRPVAKRHLAVRPVLANDSSSTLVGRTAQVVQDVTDDSGQVRIDGELWRARPAVPGEVLPTGSRVLIDSVSGATVAVYPTP